MDRSIPINRFIVALEKVNDLEILDAQFLTLIILHNLIRYISDGSIGKDRYLVIYKGKILYAYVGFHHIEIAPIKDSYILNGLRKKNNLRNYIWIDPR